MRQSEYETAQQQIERVTEAYVNAVLSGVPESIALDQYMRQRQVALRREGWCNNSFEDARRARAKAFHFRRGS